MISITALAGGKSNGHEHPDGFVERAVQIVIRDNTATIQYSFGLNDNTRSQLLAYWTTGDLTPPDDSFGSTETGPAIPAKPESAVESSSIFEQLALERLVKGLRIEVDGQSVELQAVDIEPAPRHHYSYVATLTFQLADSKSVEMIAVDRNFEQLNGAARYAIKALGSTILLKSSAAPIVVRAPRHDLTRLAPARRAEICSVRATVANVTDAGSANQEAQQSGR